MSELNAHPMIVEGSSGPDERRGIVAGSLRSVEASGTPLSDGFNDIYILQGDVGAFHAYRFRPPQPRLRECAEICLQCAADCERVGRAVSRPAVDARRAAVSW